MNAMMSALAWSLLDFVWQGLLIGWIAALALGLLRHARPQTRYALACGALLLCAALPLSSLIGQVQTPAPRSSALAALSDAPGPAASTELALQARAPDEPRSALVQRLSAWEGALQERLPMVVLLWSLGACSLACGGCRHAPAPAATAPIPSGNSVWTGWPPASA